MLQTIREHTQGWIAGTIISIIIVSFALWGIHSYFEGGHGNVNVAEVNGIAITKEQLAVAYERLRRNVQLQYGANRPITSKDEAGLKSRALQNLIEIEVLKQASISQGFNVSDRQIDNYLQGMTDFQVDGRFSVERLQEFLSSSLLSTSEFLDLIRTSLLISQPKLGIVMTSYALPNEAKYTIALVNQERDIAYINIGLQNFIATKQINITPDKIKAYYEQNKTEFMTPEQVNVDYIELALKDLAAKITPTDSMLNNFYNENINSYTQAMQWKYTLMTFPIAATATEDEVAKVKKKAEMAAQAIKAGADFTKVASNNSATLSSQGWQPLNQVSSELQKALANLNKPGQISEPFRTNNGIVLIKADAIQEPKILPFDVVKQKVKESYARQHAEEKFAELRDKLADLTYEHPDSLQYAAKELSLPITSSELFSRDKGGDDLSQNKKVREAAFSNDVLNLQNNSDVIQVSTENVIVLRVKSHVASKLLPLDEVSKQIETKLKSQEAENLTEKFANEIKDKLQSGTDPNTLASNNKLTWTQAGLLGRYSTQVDTAILDLAFRMPNPTLAKNKVIYGVTRIPNGYAVVALKNVKDGVIDDKKEFAVFAEQTQNSDGALEYELYKLSQMNNAKISNQQ